MKTLILRPLLVGIFILASVVSLDEFEVLDDFSTNILTPRQTDPPTTQIPTEPVEENELRVSFVRGKHQKKLEKPQEEAEEREKDEITTGIPISFDLTTQMNETQNETTTAKPKVKVQRQKIRRKRPFSQRRVFADRIFGKKYGQGKPTVITNKLKHDLLPNSTNEEATDKPNLAENNEEQSSRKRKRNLQVWQQLMEAGKPNTLVHKIIHDIAMIGIDQAESQTEVLSGEAEDFEKPTRYNAVAVNESEKSEEIEFEPPKKALLTYRQVVERRLQKLNEAIESRSKNVDNENSNEDGSGEIGDLPDDHESAPLEENVLSVMAEP